MKALRVNAAVHLLDSSLPRMVHSCRAQHMLAALGRSYLVALKDQVTSHQTGESVGTERCHTIAKESARD